MIGLLEDKRTIIRNFKGLLAEKYIERVGPTRMVIGK